MRTDNQTKKLLINKIKEIGKACVCSNEDLNIFLPNFPKLYGNEFIFSIGWANANKFIDEDIVYFIKGLHTIEKKYKVLSQNDFGFGSPSPTYKVISSLEKEEPNLANQLKEWVKKNGGNYYISNNYKK